MHNGYYFNNKVQPRAAYSIPSADLSTTDAVKTSTETEMEKHVPRVSGDYTRNSHYKVSANTWFKDITDEQRENLSKSMEQMYIVNTLSSPRAKDPFDPTDVTVKAPPLDMLYVTSLSFDVPSFNGKIEDLASHLNQQVPFTNEILPHTDVFPVLGSVPVYPTDPTVSSVVTGASVTTYKPSGTGQQEYNIEDNQSLATVGHERVRSFRQVFVKPVKICLQCRKQVHRNVRKAAIALVGKHCLLGKKVHSQDTTWFQTDFVYTGEPISNATCRRFEVCAMERN